MRCARWCFVVLTAIDQKKIQARERERGREEGERREDGERERKRMEGDTGIVKSRKE
jgi:hypothetical protein